MTRTRRIRGSFNNRSSRSALLSFSVPRSNLIRSPECDALLWLETRQETQEAEGAARQVEAAAKKAAVRKRQEGTEKVETQEPEPEPE